jgi:S1-C subfamily serine protease
MPTEVPATATLPALEPTPAATLMPLATSPAPIEALIDIEQAILRIEAKGKFYTPKLGPKQVDVGFGSGFLIDPSGLAITNSHAVAGADEVQAWVGPGAQEPVTADVIAVSECADLALIDLEGENYPYLGWSDNPVETGQKIYLAGYNFPEQRIASLGGTLNEVGVTASSNRFQIDNAITYETSSEPAFTGGPLLTPDAKVIGVHYLTDPETGISTGLFRERVLELVEQLRAGQNPDSIGINGIAVSDDDNFLSGIGVLAVMPGTPADQAGIAGGDLILSLDEVILGENGDIASYCEVLRGAEPGAALSLEVLRGAADLLYTGELNGKPLAEFNAPTVVPGTGTPTPNLRASQPGEIFLSVPFDQNLDRKTWKFFVTSGLPETVSAKVADGVLTFELSSIYTYPYYIYLPLETANVRLTIWGSNQGRNANNVTLVCRYSEAGWYEFNVASNGYYFVKRFDPSLPDIEKYVAIGSGASRRINMGQKANQYGAICKDDKLTLLINDVEVRTFRDATLTSGKVGFGVGSFNVTPVVIQLDDFIASVP